MEGTRIVTLYPEGGDSASFEEAFGEFSEAGGRGKARRQAMKSRRNQRNEARIARKQRKVDSRIARKEARMDRKDERGSMLGNILTGGVSGMAKRRRNKRAKRKESQEQEREARLQNPRVTPVGGGEQEGSAQESTMEQQSQGGYQEQGGNGGGYQEQSSGGESQSQPQYQEREQQNWGSEGYDQYNNNPFNSTSDEESEDEYGNDEEGAEYGESSSDYADGGEDFENESYGVDGRNKKLSINPKLREATRRIALLESDIKELKQLSDRISKKLEGDLSHNERVSISGKLSEVKAKIARKRENIDKLKDMIGSYSSASGGQFNKRRRAEIRAARKLALMDSINRRKRELDLQKRGNNEVPVDRELNPSFSKNKIVIDKQEANNYSKAEGNTGLIALDNETEVDSPDTRKINLNFEGNGAVSKTQKTVLYVLAGVGVAALGIYLVKKYKLIK